MSDSSGANFIYNIIDLLFISTFLPANCSIVTVAHRPIKECSKFIPVIQWHYLIHDTLSFGLSRLVQTTKVNCFKEKLFVQTPNTYIYIHLD